MRASPAERGGRKDISAPHSVSVTAPGQRTGTMSNAEALRLTVQILDNLHAQIRATDEKTRALFAGSAIFVAALTLTGQQALSQLKSKEQGTLILIAYAVLLATLAFSLISAVLALRPRLTHRPVAERSLFYFGDIQGLEPADYVRAFMGLSVEAGARPGFDPGARQRQDRAEEVPMDPARCHRFRRRHRGVAGRTACVLVPLTCKREPGARAFGEWEVRAGPAVLGSAGRKLTRYWHLH